VPRTRVAPTKPKEKISVTIDQELYAWAVEHTGVGKEFASISHAVERSLWTLRDHGKKSNAH
jgi:hypothetical protein